MIRTSVSTFMEFIGNNPNAFRLLLRERSGTSAAFRAAVARDPALYCGTRRLLELENHMPRAFTEAQAEAMVTIVLALARKRWMSALSSAGSWRNGWYCSFE